MSPLTPLLPLSPLLCSFFSEGWEDSSVLSPPLTGSERAAQVSALATPVSGSLSQTPAALELPNLLDICLVFKFIII